MVTPEKINEIHKLLRRGIPDGELKNKLINEGFSEEDIKEIFKPKKIDMRSWYLTFGIIIFLFGLWVLMHNGGLLPIILGGILLFLYYKEEQKIINNKSS